MKPTRILRLITFGVSLLAILAVSACAPTSAQQTSIQYYSPLKGADYVSTGATVAVRYGPSLTQKNISGLKFNVTGTQSGTHAGHVILARDSQTVIFKP